MNFGTLGTGFGGMGRGGAGVDPYSTASILALLAGSGGMVLDPTDITTLFQDTAGSTPVAASTDPVGRINELLNGWNFLQGTAANKPLYDVTSGIKSLLLVSSDDLRLTSGAGLSAFKNKGYITIIAAVKIASDGSSRTIFHISNGSSSQSTRAGIRKNASDKAEATGRRLDADTAQQKASTASMAGAWHVIIGEFDYANGIESIQIDLNAAEIGSPTWGAGSASENTDSIGISIGSAMGAVVGLGNVGRMAAIPEQLWAADKETLVRWAGAGANLFF